MKCAKHTDREAVAQCAECGAYICSECAEKTAELKEHCGVLCVECYRKEIEGARDFYVGDRKKKLRRIITSCVLYVVGLLAIISAFAIGAQGIELFWRVLIGLLFCGWDGAVAGWRKGEQAQEEYERKYGATYTVTDDGVYKEDGFFKKLIMSLIGMVIGVIVTPINVIRYAVGMKKDKVNVEMFERELAAISED